MQDWSDEDSNHEEASMNLGLFNRGEPTQMSLKLIRSNNSLRPPQKSKYYTEYDPTVALEWKKKHTQPPWWLDKIHNVKISSVHPAAKICEFFRTGEPVTTLSEWCLMREILWMMQLEPNESDTSQKFSKFFTLNNDTDEIVVNSNISIPSVTVDGIQTILNEFADAMTILYRFRRFTETIFQHTKAISSFIETSICAPPYTIQCYAHGLKEFLNLIAETITKLEIELIEQDPMEIRTIVGLYNEMLPHFRLLQKLNDIHRKVYIDFKTNAGWCLHVC